MTEEMINGVDVSGCEYINCCCYENGKCLWTKRYYENNIVPDCEEVQDCYYKQLKRLETENAKLKDENFKLGQIDIKKVTLVENRQLEEENAKLKEALKKIKSIIDNDFSNRYMELGFNEYDDILEQIEKICEVLKDE